MRRTDYDHHGDSGSVEYHAWENMIARCLNPKHGSFRLYGARGISVCKKWLEYPKFLMDMGRKPTPLHELERIKNNKGYSPANCRWATRIEQMQNTRKNRMIMVAGESICIAEASRRLGINQNTLRHRVKRGFPLDYCEHRYVTVHGKSMTVAQAAARLGITYNTAYWRFVVSQKQKASRW